MSLRFSRGRAAAAKQATRRLGPDSDTAPQPASVIRRGRCPTDRRAAWSAGRRTAALLLLWLSAGSCASVVQYTDELRDERTGRSVVVRSTAAAGGAVGLVAGLPVSLAAVPVTYVVYLTEKARSPLRADPLSILLFPSFVLWRAGSLLAAPFDLVEWALFRAGADDLTPTAEEQERIELEHDERVLQSYPVEPIYPTERDRRRAARSSGELQDS